MATSGPATDNDIAIAPPPDENGLDDTEEQQEKPDMECINISENKVKYINNKYEKVHAKMYDYKSDIKLKVGTSNFKAHRNVLQAASDYFAAMFSHEMKEKEQNEIELKDISPPGFSAMLEYFYHGHITIDPENVADVLEAARFFHVDWILDVCCDFMVRHLSLLNYPFTMELSDRFSLGDLRWEIFRHFGQNLPALMQHESFYRDVSADLLMQFLMEYMYVEVSEFFLLQMIVQWVKADENRKDQLLMLLRQLRFCSMEIEELEDIPPEVLEFQEIRDQVEEAKNYCLDVAGQCLKTDEKFLFRGSRNVVTVLSFNEEGNTVMYKDPENPSLFIEQLNECALTTDYGSTGQAAIGNFLFAAGGYNEEFTSSGRVYRYDPRFREWTEVASMNEARVSFAMCSSGKRLFVLGGVFHTVRDVDENEKILSSVEMYNPEENAWKNIANLPYASFDQASVFCEDRLYITGGISSLPTHPVPMNSMLSWTDGADTWSELPPMLTPRQGHSMTSHSGKLFVLGGYTCGEESMEFVNCLQNEAFDLEVQQWTKISVTPEDFGHIYRHVGLLGCKIYFLCGSMREVWLNSFDTDTDTMENGVMVGPGIQKLAILQVAYPCT